MNAEQPFRLEKLAPNLDVKSIEDRRLGSVSFLNNCCIEFDRRDGSGMTSVRIDGLFDVQDGSVTLMCEAREVGRYSCPLHPSPSPSDMGFSPNSASAPTMVPASR